MQVAIKGLLHNVCSELCWYSVYFILSPLHYSQTVWQSRGQIALYPLPHPPPPLCLASLLFWMWQLLINSDYLKKKIKHLIFFHMWYLYVLFVTVYKLDYYITNFNIFNTLFCTCIHIAFILLSIHLLSINLISLSSV